MKTSVKIAIVVVAAGAVGTVAYKLANRLPSPDQTAEMQVQQILDDGGCLSCHSENPDLPFYASWPVAGNIVRSDVEKGHRPLIWVQRLRRLPKDGLSMRFPWPRWKRRSATAVCRLPNITLCTGFIDYRCEKGQVAAVDS